ISLMLKITVPIIVVVIGEGGSGGALAIGIGDSITMLENSIFSVISPEGCASILWRDADLAPKAASALKLTAQDLLEIKIIDHIINEPLGGAHRDSEVIFYNLKDYFLDTLKKLTKLSKSQLLAKRSEKYRLMGIFTDSKAYNEVH
ncbi:MAG: acetyl-CoA carboxylase carboxyl transferase subunit alpha, partial [Armatimonadetes bacterium]|nr:acetyl-CoA carboxylase carboxyl transferase subunit alpha [Armatimonadota bacterium]